MSGWTPEELTRIGRAAEFRIGSRRADGSLRQFITIWVVREGDNLYVRSAHGYDNPWFQRALRSGQGRIQAGGIERESRSRSRNSTQRPGSPLPTTRSTTATVRRSSGQSFPPRLSGPLSDSRPGSRDGCAACLTKRRRQSRAVTVR
jgi:hypothetical protein